MKSFITMAAVLVVGLAAGGLLGWHAASSRTAGAHSLQEIGLTSETALAEAQDRVDQLETELALLQARVAAAEADSVKQANEEHTDSVGDLFEDLAAAPTVAAPPADPAPGATPTEEAERRAKWEQRRREFAARIRERVGDFLQAEMDATGDPNVQDRLEAMGEYVDYYMELRAALRAAETEEEKEELRGTLADATQTMRELLTEQQNEILRDVLSEQGIAAGQKQDEFIAALRQAQSSPFFRSPFPMGDYAQRGGGGQ